MEPNHHLTTRKQIFFLFHFDFIFIEIARECSENDEMLKRDSEQQLGGCLRLFLSRKMVEFWQFPSFSLVT